MARFFHMLAFRPLHDRSPIIEDWRVTVLEAPARRAAKIHRAWFVAAVAFVATVGAAGFRATPGVLLTPLHEEPPWYSWRPAAA